MRVFFDASIIIAAVLSPVGGSAKLFRYIQTNTIIGITSQTVIEEVLNKTEKIHASKDKIEKFIARHDLLVRESITEEDVKPYEELIDRDDAHLIAGAVRTKCAYIVTLDKKHLLRLDIKNKFLPLAIVSPKELLKLIIENNSFT